MVRELLSLLGQDFIAHNVSSPLKHEQLVQAGGKADIPFLLDHSSGVKLYGAWAITAYLENHYGKPRTFFSRLRSKARQITWAVLEPYEKSKRLQRDALETWHALKGAWVSVKQAMEAETEAAQVQAKDESHHAA